MLYNFVRNICDIVVGLNYCRFPAKPALYHVRIDCALNQEVYCAYLFCLCLEDADKFFAEIAAAGLDRELNQYFAALTNMRSVGVMGDESFLRHY